MSFNIGDTVKIVSDPHGKHINLVGRTGMIMQIKEGWYQVVGVGSMWAGWFRVEDLELVNG